MPLLDFGIDKFSLILKILTFLSLCPYYFENSYFNIKLYFHHISVLDIERGEKRSPKSLKIKKNA
jgi:hypothetical protein